MKRLYDAVDATLKRMTHAGFSSHIVPETWLHRAPLAGFGAPGLWSANRTCRLIATQDGWLAVNLARESDQSCVAAWTGCALDSEPWAAVVAYARTKTSEILLSEAVALHLPVSIVGEAAPATAPTLSRCAQRTGQPSALDLSALWAGPLCGGVLAAAGVAVTRIESVTRPDPTAFASPALDHRLNGAKSRLKMELGDRRLLALIAATDILITSGRPHALARHGLNEDRLFALNPNLIWVAITAHGWYGESALRVGFGDDAAAAGALLGGTAETPYFVGDALADPLTGIDAAVHALDALAAGSGGLIDAALAPTAARYAQQVGWH